jgi:hypothetical protein
MRAKSRNSIKRYTQLITEHNNQIINLNNAIKEYGIANCVKGWVDSGVARPSSGRGMYKILSNNPRQDAGRILSAVYKHNLERREKPKKSESKKPERKPAIIQMERIDKAKKKISILWGMIKIEQ